MSLFLMRSCRGRSSSVVIVSGISLVLCLFYILTSRTSHLNLEADSFPRASKERFNEGVHVVGRDRGGVPLIQDGNGGQIPMAVDVEHRIGSERRLDSVDAHTSREY